MNSDFSRAYDALLIVRFQAGCNDSLEELITRHAGSVRAAVVKRIGGESCVADDISQEIWIQVIRNLNKLDQPITWQAWLFQIVNRQVAMFFRKKKRPLVPIESVIDSIADVEKRVENGLDIRELVESLPEPFRMTIRLRYWDTKSYEAIARVMEVPVGTVRSRLYEARRKLTDKVYSLEGNHE